MSLPAIRSLSIRHTVADAIRQALRQGQFQPGENLNEVGLATEFQISRGPVREALLVLTQEGLLTHSPNRGFSVLHFTAKDRAQIDDVRLLLETRALELGRERLTPEDAAHLEKLKKELVARFHPEQLAARDAAEMAFHSFIWELSGNPWLVSSLRSTMLPYFTYSRPFGLIESTLAPELATERHQLYVEYLRKKTSKSARECVAFHLGIG